MYVVDFPEYITEETEKVMEPGMTFTIGRCRIC